MFLWKLWCGSKEDEVKNRSRGTRCKLSDQVITNTIQDRSAKRKKSKHPVKRGSSSDSNIPIKSNKRKDDKRSRNSRPNGLVRKPTNPKLDQFSSKLTPVMSKDPTSDGFTMVPKSDKDIIYSFAQTTTFNNAHEKSRQKAIENLGFAVWTYENDINNSLSTVNIKHLAGSFKKRLGMDIGRSVLKSKKNKLRTFSPELILDRGAMFSPLDVEKIGTIKPSQLHNKAQSKFSRLEF